MVLTLVHGEHNVDERIEVIAPLAGLETEPITARYQTSKLTDTTVFIGDPVPDTLPGVAHPLREMHPHGHRRLSGGSVQDVSAQRAHFDT